MPAPSPAPGIIARIRAAGLDVPAYREVMAARADADPAGLDVEAAERIAFTRLNLHRSDRILRHWRPSPRLATLLARETVPRTWLVLTEPWCGDSAQCLPCLAVMAAGQPAITLRMLLRDDHLDIMDRYLTGGKRSIPVLVALDPEGREHYRWGPRPAAAQAVFAAAKAAGLEKPAILEKLHRFYGRDRGRALDAEFVALLEARRDDAP